MLDQIVGKILNRCFPKILDLPSGMDVFADAERDKNFSFLVEVSHRLAREELEDIDFNFSKMFARHVRMCVPVEHRSEFIRWMCTRYLSDPRVYSYLYGTSRPLSETDRKLNTSDFNSLMSISNSLDE